MSDLARELAHIIRPGDEVCTTPLVDEAIHSVSCDRLTRAIASAIRTARNEALEEAAKVADDVLVHGIPDEIICGDTAILLAAAIRSLKDKCHD